ncbi:MAG: PAS domain-containing protein, partial [Defluviitaleaceae bacterium]|nr:PAS domain-containing protein [Defluviitaleaceae bacterium]
MNVKNSNSTKKRPLPQYFIAAILVIAVLLVIIPLTTVYMLTRAYDEQIRIETKQISFSIQQTVQSFVGGAYNLSQELAANPSVLTMDAEILTPILADCVARNDYMLLLYITGTDGMQIARSSGQPGDRSGRFWYIQMMETEKPFVSPSYYSLTTSMPCTSVFFPMYEKNSDEMIGILGADIDLASLQRLTEQFASPDSGRFSFIIDGEGVVIAHPDNDFLETLTNYKTLIKTVSVTDDFGNAVLNPDTSVVTRDEEFFVSDGFKQVIESVMNGSGGLEIVEYDGADFFMSYESISLPGFSDSWSVITLQNRTVAMSAASQLFAQVIIIVVCVLAIFVLLIAGFIKTLRTTIKNLEQAQSTTRTVLDTNPQAIVLFDSDFKVVNCNPSAINLLRFNSKKELRENFFERIEKYLPKVQPEGRISIPVTERLKLAATDGYNRVETELHLGNGSKNLLVEMVRIPYANSFAVILYAYDMTDLRIREKELLKAHESNELHLTKLDAVVKSTKIGLYDVSINENNFLHEQNTVVFTDEFRNMLGYSNENDFPSTLENWKKHLHPEDEKQAVEAVVRHISDKSGQTPYDEEYRLLKKNGEYAYFRACGEAIRDKNGNVIRIAGALMDITAAKNRLRDSEQQRIAAEAANERFRIMLDTTPLICNLWNKDGKVFDCNEAALKLFDMNKKDYMEKFLQLAPEIQPDGKFTADIARDMLEKVFSEGSCTFEYIAQKLDGTPIPQHVTLTRVTYEGEHIAVGYGRDLREHKRMMLELEAAQATTFAMFDANPNVNILFSSRFEVIDCNSFALKFLGFETKYEMINGFAERIAKALPKIQPDGRISTSLAERLNAAVQNGTEKFETELFLINRKIIWEVEFRKIPYEDNFAIIAFARDITDTRRRQLELMKANEINELQLTKLNLIIGATQIALWDMYVIKEDPTNPANEIVYSDEFRNMLGYENENDFPNLISSWSDKLHPEDKKNAVDAFAAHMLDKTGKTPFDIEYRLQKKDGEYSFFHAWGETVRDDDGNPVHVAGALMDITEEKNIIINTERLRHQAEEANKAKSVFLANMSHEIRTPLNAVIGLSDLILQSNEWNDENYYRLERINSAGTTLLSTVNDILDISKIESGKFELVPTTYDIPSMINSTVTQSILHRGEKPIEFLMNVCENIPAYLHGDELRMKQILNNFLSNAFKYTLAGTVELSASAERDGENVWLTFTIRDTGIGIKKEDMEKLFSDYVQLDMSANR